MEYARNKELAAASFYPNKNSRREFEIEKRCRAKKAEQWSERSFLAKRTNPQL
jgi:hypothetical protein